MFKTSFCFLSVPYSFYFQFSFFPSSPTHQKSLEVSLLGLLYIWICKVAVPRVPNRFLMNLYALLVPDYAASLNMSLCKGDVPRGVDVLLINTHTHQDPGACVSVPSNLSQLLQCKLGVRWMPNMFLININIGHDQLCIPLLLLFPPFSPDPSRNIWCKFSDFHVSIFHARGSCFPELHAWRRRVKWIWRNLALEKKTLKVKETQEVRH